MSFTSIFSASPNEPSPPLIYALQNRPVSNRGNFSLQAPLLPLSNRPVFHREISTEPWSPQNTKKTDLASLSESSSRTEPASTTQESSVEEKIASKEECFQVATRLLHASEECLTFEQEQLEAFQVYSVEKGDSTINGKNQASVKKSQNVLELAQVLLQQVENDERLFTKEQIKKMDLLLKQLEEDLPVYYSVMREVFKSLKKWETATIQKKKSIESKNSKNVSSVLKHATRIDITKTALDLLMVSIFENNNTLYVIIPIS